MGADLPAPAYLGDGVYVSPDPGGLVVTTGHHDPAQAENAIYLDPGVARRLRDYLSAALAAWATG